MKNNKVIILAKNLRGAYLSCELAGQGYDVTLLNLNYDPQELIDQQQPFAYLENPDSNYFQKQFLFKSTDKNNFSELSYWLGDGPVGLSSPFVKETLKEKQISHEQVMSWVENTYSIDLSQQRVSGTLDPYAPYTSYQVDESSIEEVMRLLSNSGVEMVNNLQNPDLTYSHKNKISFKREESSHEYDKMICLLSAFELEEISSTTKEFVYGAFQVEPDWVWLSSNLKHNFCEALESAPSDFYLLGDDRLDFTYSNFVFFKKLKNNVLQAWMRWPKSQLENQKYMIEELKLVQELLQSNMFGLRIEDVSLNDKHSKYLPNAYLYDSKKLTQFKKKLKRKKNIIYLGPEFWSNWNMPNVYQLQYERSMRELTR